MKTFKVKDLMVPLEEYATIPEDANLYEAVMALEKAQVEFDQTKYRHRAILVYDRNNKIVGKLSQLDVLRALEPKYDEMKSDSAITHFGFSKKFLGSLLETYKLFDKPLEHICKKAGEVRVGRYMHRPTEGEFIDVEASLDEAIHQLVLGHHQSLLVTEKEEIIGILRLTDVFAAMFHVMKQCFNDNTS